MDNITNALGPGAPLPPQGVPTAGVPHPNSVPGLAGQHAGGQSPFNSQTIGGMTVQQVLDAFQGGGGGGMMGGFRNALMGLMHPQGSGPAGWLQGMGMFHPQGGGGPVMTPGGGPVMTPGGGMGGGPPQGVGMVPGVPGSMGLNPGMGGPIQGQQQPNYQLPNY